MIFCYEAGRRQVHGMNVRLRPIEEMLRAYEQMAAWWPRAASLPWRRTHASSIRPLPVANANGWSAELGLPTMDVIRDGCDRLVQTVRQRHEELLQLGRLSRPRRSGATMSTT